MLSHTEVEKMQHLHQLAERHMQDPINASRAFRGAAKKSGLKSAFHTKRIGGFVQYRGGFKDGSASSDRMVVEAHDADWKERMGRVYAGINAVAQKMHGGASIQDLNATFHTYLHPDKDVIYGDVVTPTGYRGLEESKTKELVAGVPYMLGVAVASQAKPRQVGFHYPTFSVLPQGHTFF